MAVKLNNSSLSLAVIFEGVLKAGGVEAFFDEAVLCGREENQLGITEVVIHGVLSLHGKEFVASRSTVPFPASLHADIGISEVSIVLVDNVGQLFRVIWRQTRRCSKILRGQNGALIHIDLVQKSNTAIIAAAVGGLNLRPDLVSNLLNGVVVFDDTVPVALINFDTAGAIAWATVVSAAAVLHIAIKVLALAATAEVEEALTLHVVGAFPNVLALAVFIIAGCDLALNVRNL